MLVTMSVRRFLPPLLNTTYLGLVRRGLQGRWRWREEWRESQRGVWRERGLEERLQAMVRENEVMVERLQAIVGENEAMVKRLKRLKMKHEKENMAREDDGLERELVLDEFD